MLRKGLKRNRAFKNSFHIFLFVFSWIIFLYTLFQVEPVTWQPYYYAPFFIITYLVVAATLRFFLSHWAPVVLIPAGLVMILVFRLFSFRDWYYPFLIIGLCVTLIYFFTIPEKDDNLSSDSSINQTRDKSS